MQTGEKLKACEILSFYKATLFIAFSSNRCYHFPDNLGIIIQGDFYSEKKFSSFR